VKPTRILSFRIATGPSADLDISDRSARACYVHRASGSPLKLFLPLHQVCLAPVFLDESADAIAAFAGAFGAFDAEQVELAFDVAKDEISPPRHDG
jgi:hypothetical protein